MGALLEHSALFVAPVHRLVCESPPGPRLSHCL